MSNYPDFRKLPSPKRKQHPNKPRIGTPLFNDAGYKLAQSKEELEFDGIDLDEEYDKPFRGKETKRDGPRETHFSSLFDGVGYKINPTKEKSDFDRKYDGMPSELDKLDLEAEYNKPFRKNVVQDECVESKDILDYEDWNDVAFGKHSSTSSSHFSELLETIPDGSVQEQTEQTQETPEKIDRAFAIASDFVRQEKLIIVEGAVWIYNGRFYSILHEEEAMQLIFEHYRSEISRASPMSTLRNAAALIKYSIKKRFGEFPTNSHLIVFENGTLEVDSGRFRNNSPDDLASSALGINYDPKLWEMPNTQKFLETIADGDDDLYELMLQVIGYILSNDIKAKSFFYLEGVGNAGKSRFCDLIASFFPISGANKVARIALQDLGGKFALGNLVNAKLNISEDLPDSPLSPTTVSRIKMISDSNRLEAEAKYVQAFSFKPQCKLLFASNHPLRLKEYDAAFENRVVYLPFLRAIPKHKQDTMILEKMQAELPALFNHSFAAYKRLANNGYVWAGADRFKPEICIVNSGISVDKEDILRRFVADCCILEEDAVTPTADLQYSYQRFCNENHYPAIIGDRFSRELKNVLPDTVTRVKIGNQQRGFKGIKLNDIRKMDILKM